MADGNTFGFSCGSGGINNVGQIAGMMKWCLFRYSFAAKFIFQEVYRDDIPVLYLGVGHCPVGPRGIDAAFLQEGKWMFLAQATIGYQTGGPGVVH